MPPVPQVKRVSQRVFGSVTPHVPVSVKRPLKRALPRRYWRYVDPDWHRKAIGLPWAELGQLQFDFLVGRGLKPEHYLLDVGCGPLRAGVHFIRYLEAGHYYGIDLHAELLAAGRDVELPRHGLVDKRPVLTVMADFDFRKLDRQFDFALAQSVFTHLPLNHIIRCLMRMEEALAPGGQFYATIYENARASGTSTRSSRSRASGPTSTRTSSTTTSRRSSGSARAPSSAPSTWATGRTPAIRRCSSSPSPSSTVRSGPVRGLTPGTSAWDGDCGPGSRCVAAAVRAPGAASLPLDLPGVGTSRV